MIYDIYEEGYAATGESRGAIYLGQGEGETFDDACKDYIKRTGYGEYGIIPGYSDLVGASNWGCRWFPSLEEARKSFG